jgi:hypothetical protein
MPLIAFITVDPKGSAPSAEAVRATWAELWPDQPPLPPIEAGDGPMVFKLGDEMCAVSWMPGPIPWSDLHGPAACAWHWPEAEEALKSHTAHLVIAVLDAEPDVDTAKRLTRLTAATLATTPYATGVYWAAGAAVSPAPRFVNMARGMDQGELPILTWLELRVFQDTAGAWCVFTTGLGPLGLMEIEVSGSSTDPRELLDRVLGFSNYQAENGPVLLDGHTIGASAEERITVRHGPSAWDRPGPVLHLDL